MKVFIENKPLFSLLIISGFSLCLSACTLFPTWDYFKPTYPEHNVRYRKHQGGCPGPLEVAIIRAAKGVNVAIEYGPPMELGLELSANKTVRFESDQIGFFKPKTQNSWKRSMPPFSISQNLDLPPTTKISAQRLMPTVTDSFTKIGPSTLSYSAFINFRTGGYIPENGFIQFPRIYVNGKTYDVPAVEFWEDGFYKNQFYATPIEFAGFSIDTEVWRFKKSLHYRFRLFPPMGSEWSFTSDQIKFLSQDLREQNVEIIDNLRIALKTSLPITRALRNSKFISQSKVKAVLSVGHMGLQTIMVQLPPLIIEGERVEFAPITFEKTSGFGIIGC